MTTKYKLVDHLTAADLEALDGLTVKVEVNPGKSLHLIPLRREHAAVRLLEAIKPRVKAQDNGQPAEVPVASSTEEA